MATGDSLLPDGVKDNFKLSKKNANGLQSLVFDNNSKAWTVSGSVNDYIGNTATETDLASNNLAIVAYESYNSPMVQSDPKPVKLVSNKVIAGNSYSWYKGGGIVNAVTGKVSVGNGSNGLESKVLENQYSIKEHDKILNPYGSTGELIAGNTYIYTGGAIAGNIGHLYKRLSYHPGGTIKNFDFTDRHYWEDLGLATTPTHQTFTLDNSNSPAAKVFTTIEEDDNGELLLGVYGEEMIYDGSDWGDEGKFTQLTNGTRSGANGTVRTYHGIKRLGVYNG